MANAILVNPQESQMEGVNVGFLGHDQDVQPRQSRCTAPGRCMVPMPLMKHVRRTPALGGTVDVVDIEGLDPIEALGSDWSDKLVGKGGLLCPRAPVVFDPSNRNGAVAWGPSARGAIVVAVRGVASFEEVALNAGASGARALIIVDNEPRWKNNWVMTSDTGTSPSVPTVLVPMKYGELMCGGRPNMTAAISRRPSKLSSVAIARNAVGRLLPPF